MSLKLYKISQTVNTGYNTFDSAVVVAESETDASLVHPDGFCAKWDGEAWKSERTTGMWTRNIAKILSDASEAIGK